MMTGRPISSTTAARLVERVGDAADGGTARPISTIACLNRSRSSAVAMASALAPIISGVPGTPMSPCSNSAMARFRPVWPPSVGSTASGRSRSMIARQHLRRQRLDVGRVGEVGVGHDRRRVRVGEDDAVALLAQHPAGLGAGVVELAGLADHDRSRADDEDRVEVGRAWASGRSGVGLGEPGRFASVGAVITRSRSPRSGPSSSRTPRTGSWRRAGRGRPRGGTAR